MSESELARLLERLGDEDVRAEVKSAVERLAEENRQLRQQVKQRERFALEAIGSL